MFDNTEIQIIHTELTNVIKIVTSITDRLGRKQSQYFSDKRTKEALQDRIVFLEGEARKLQEENGRLKGENSESVSKIDEAQNRERLQGKEIQRLIDERDDALERLDKVENMFKGIFHGEKPRTPTPTRERRSDSASEVRDKGKQAEKRVSWTSNTQASSIARSASPSMSVQSGSTERTERTFKAMSTVSGSSMGSSSVHSRHSSGGRNEPPRRKIQISDADGREWYIEAETPPATASRSDGPFELAHLVERLGIAENDAMKLDQRVILSNRLGPRLHIHKNCMFVFDPLWLELAEHTCLIDWSEKKVHDDVKAYLHRKVKSSAVFHLFSFPLKKNGWFYLGPHKIQITDLLDLWPQLRQEEKDTFVTRMKIRAQNGGLGADEIVEMADSGNLTQSTVELWRASGGDSAARFVDRISG